MVTTTPDATAAIAVNRFGLGKRASEPFPAEPRRWLLDQIAEYEPHPSAFTQLQTTPEIATNYADDRQKLQALAGDERIALQQELNKAARLLYRSEIEARGLNALQTPTPFMEALVHFWSNHFAVSADNPPMLSLAGAFEREAIRPHITGHFTDLLFAVEQHPAMLIYLDQIRSAGPDSPLAARAKRRNADKLPGINENLAREIMELHTVGVGSGYTQKDVTEFALALTGWSAGRMGGKADTNEAGVFQYRPGLHQPGDRLIRHRVYGATGEDQAGAVLKDLASDPATAKHIATKLCRHFISDTPPHAVVNRVSKAFLASDGNLPTVYEALVQAPQAWTSQSSKIKTPWEWLVSAMRGLDYPDLGKANFANLLDQLGQPVWLPRSPAGYDDIAASWLAPDALVRRVEVSQRLAAKADRSLKPQELADNLLGNALTDTTATEINRAESIQTGVALLLVSPDFQRR
ncbi:DUF1800 domain-containing protein [Phyllobacterium myrsinacearum]|uniref:Uncharacterized protein (DUF1800 family) n=1 Tax=Phyllobacterium myrsinacearum TaxID=28101 RepID=A0A839ENG7_9HYPH|nr:DUF1800 domain-containing protein [Phyllobacterium myrsinacearum]MBA8878200.1 uncharacterized protein (DUF1800 family) [Phyllobacterium myrsinacearum]